MKIGYKLVLSYLLIALLASLATYTLLRSYQNAEGLKSSTNDAPSVIKLLVNLREAGSDVASSTRKITIIYSESALLSSYPPERLLDAEENKLNSAYARYEESVKQLENLANASNFSLPGTIKKSGDELVKTSAQIVAMKKKGVAGETVLNKREEFKSYETTYLKSVEEALAFERAQSANERLGIKEIISSSGRPTAIAGLLTFISAIGLGLFISRQIVGRIVNLKKASENIGRGHLETYIEIESEDEIGDLTHSFNRMVDFLKHSRADLAAAKDFTDKVLNSMVDFVVITDMDLIIRRVNKAALDLNGYEESELIGSSINILSGGRSFSQKDLDVLRKKGHFANLYSSNLNKDRSITPILMSVSVIKDTNDNELGIVWVGKDISERKREEAEHLAINEIVQSVVRSSNLDELFNIAHQSISKVIYAENCFIALHNPFTDLMRFEFWRDEFDPVPPPSPIGKSFTGYIIRTGQPLLLTEEIEKQMYERGDVVKNGTDSPSWMGVPLRIGSRVIGVLAVQHYEKNGVYNQRDLELLASVGNQLALAIERKQSEIKFKLSEAHLKEAEHIARLGSWQWDITANKVSWSDELFNIFGFQPQEFEPTFEALLESIHPDDRKTLESIIESALKGKGFRSFVHRIMRADGLIRILHSAGNVIVDETGQVTRIVGTSQDITEQRQAENELAKLHMQVKSQNQRMTNIIANMPGIVWEVFVEQDGKTQNVGFVSDQITTMLGYSVEEWLATPNFWLSIIHPEDREEVEREAYKNYGEARSGIHEFRWITRDGREIWVESRSDIIYGDENNPIGLRGVTLDISQRKAAEKEMERLNLQIIDERRRLKDILENVPCVIWEAPLDSYDQSVKLGFVNSYVSKMYGYTPEEWFSTPDFWSSCIHPDDRGELYRNSEQLFADGYGSNQARWISKSGEVIWGETNIVVVKNTKGQPIGLRGVTTDITNRKMIEESLRDSEEQHRLLFETNPQPSFIYDLETLKFLAVNEAAVRHYGYSRAEFLDTITLKDIRPPEDISVLFEKLAKVTPKRDVILSPSRHKKKDETVIDVEITSHVLDFAGSRAEIVLVNDVTERRQAEKRLRIFNQKLQQSNRELQDFAYIASHDLQEPLRKVQAFSDRLKTKYAEKLDETGLDYLERMRGAACRMQLLIEGLLMFSRVSTKAQPFAPVNLEKITREILSDLEVKIEETGAIIEVGHLPIIDADPLQMRQLMQNLVGNALKFRKPDTAPVIRIYTQQDAANGDSSNENCQIFVSDNGIGFDMQYIDKIFGVFQRLHGRAQYEGSGVGLAICRKIAERHNGTITAQSEPDAGATFIITLPLKQSKTEDN